MAREEVIMFNVQSVHWKSLRDVQALASCSDPVFYCLVFMEALCWTPGLPMAHQPGQIDRCHLPTPIGE